MRKVNIGILAHIDAGKTSLTERLLFNAGVIDRLGNVDQGTTQTDSLDLERERGITIQSAVVSFKVGDLKVNVIDTPGHSDFIAEVERALRVLDAVVLVISAVEGVQSQTRILMRLLTRLKIPTLIFISKIDRRGARDQGIFESVAPKAIEMNVPRDLGNCHACVEPLSINRAKVVEILADNNDDLLSAYLQEGQSLSDEILLQELGVQTKQALVQPLFFGSAITGVGIQELVQGISMLLPSTEGNDGSLLARVFKIERGKCGEKIAYARLYQGAIHSRDTIVYYCKEHSGELSEHKGKVASLKMLEHGAWIEVNHVNSGDIAKIGGMKEIQIGDQIGTAEFNHESYFSPPTLESVVKAQNPAATPQLYQALKKMAEQDPFINTRMDSHRQEISICLYGEVQKEVIKAELQDKFGIEILFHDCKTICIERPIQPGESVHAINWHGENEFYATVGLRIEPGPLGSGVKYQLGVELGSLPRAYHSVLKESVLTSLQEGLHGFEISDCIITLTHTEICALTLAGDFRKLGPIVLRRALALAGTEVCEPYNYFELEIPVHSIQNIIAKLMLANAVLQDTVVASGVAFLKGMIPVSGMHTFQQQLPVLTCGHGVFFNRFAGFLPIKDSKT